MLEWSVTPYLRHLQPPPTCPAHLSVIELSDFFITSSNDTFQVITGSYDAWLVTLSLLIAIGASYMALSLADMAQRGHYRAMQRLHLLTGAVSLGVGVWAMHFIGMLAFKLGTPVHYHPGITLLSAIPSLLASWVTLHMLARHTVTLPRLLAGGLAVGLGIGTMHYAGMAAMQLDPLLRYDPLLFALSILVAASLATLALWISFGLQMHVNAPESLLRLVAAIVMGLAIAGMHYTAMEAARFLGMPQAGYDPHQQNHFALAIGIAAVTVVLSLLVAAVNALARYQALLRRSEASASELKAMFDTAVDGIVKIAPNGTILAANRSTLKLLGYTEHELVGSNVSMLMPEPFQSAHDGYLEHYLRTRQARIIGSGREVLARHKSGKQIPVRLAIGESHQGNQHVFVGFLSDISEQKALARELQEREHQYRTLITNLPGAAFRCLWDEHWTPLFISDHIEQLTGWPASAFMQGQITLASLLHPTDQNLLDHEMEQARIDRGSYTLKYRIKHRDGDWIWVEEIATPVVDEETGRVRWIDGILMNINERQTLETQLRKSKQEAEAAAQAKSVFLANMSHEIRTPMNGIIGFTELVLETPLNDQQVRHLNIVRTSARSLLSLLNNVLDTAKLESGNTELEHRNFSLLGVCEQILATQSLAASKKGVALKLAYHHSLPDHYVGDPLRIQQIVLNLVSNAVKFTDAGSVTLHVRPGPAGNGVRIRVRDTGIGIAPERLERIFDPFSQADSSMTRRFGGTGLGTTIARQLAELMGGHIRVCSKVGKGTLFCVSLPLPKGQANEDELPDLAEFTLPPLRLLVADEVEQNLELIIALLGSRNHQLVTAENGEQAVKLYQQGSFDAVLLDVQMPVMNGHEACRAIRNYEQQHRRKPVPIIALTASVTEEDRRQAREAGMDGFAVKPIDLQEITGELARLTGASTERVSRKLASQSGQPPVIDTGKMREMWGSANAHARAVSRFVAQNKEVAAQLETLLQSAQIAQARQVVHRMKGTAGNLCLDELYSVLVDLEQQLNGQRTEAARRVLPRLQAGIQAAQQHCSVISAEATPTAKPLSAESVKIDWHALHLLTQKLRRGEMPGSLLETVSQQLPTPINQQVQEALDNFEPEEAANVLSQYASQLPQEAAPDV